jgi:hypothetical protein
MRKPGSSSRVSYEIRRLNGGLISSVDSRRGMRRDRCRRRQKTESATSEGDCEIEDGQKEFGEHRIWPTKL